jgi:formyltetrahydrofolate synthetase
LLAHIRNVRNHGVSVVVAVNRFHTDTDAEVALVRSWGLGLGLAN